MQTITQLTKLRKLNLSQNEKVNANCLQQILKALIKNAVIEELDIGSTGVNNDEQVLVLVGQLLTNVKAVRAIYMPRLSLSD